jgi:hypothetical protein
VYTSDDGGKNWGYLSTRGMKEVRPARCIACRRGIMRRTGQAGKYAPVLRDMVAKFVGEEAFVGPVY